jgi:hypothetical protein
MEEKSMLEFWRNLMAALLIGLVGSGIVHAGSIKSGPQVGEKVPGPFKPLNVTGPDAGQASCQYCKNGSRPVAVIFAKEITPEVARLLKSIDTATAQNKDHGMGSYLVMCSSDADYMERHLKAVAEKLQIQNTVLSLYKSGGPDRYRLAPEADVTVLLYNHLTVKANHAFKKDELNSDALRAILTDLGKMLSEN